MLTNSENCSLASFDSFEQAETEANNCSNKKRLIDSKTHLVFLTALFLQAVSTANAASNTSRNPLAAETRPAIRIRREPMGERGKLRVALRRCLLISFLEMEVKKEVGVIVFDGYTRRGHFWGKLKQFRPTACLFA